MPKALTRPQLLAVISALEAENVAKTALVQELQRTVAVLRDEVASLVAENERWLTVTNRAFPDFSQRRRVEATFDGALLKEPEAKRRLREAIIKAITSKI